MLPGDKIVGEETLVRALDEHWIAGDRDLICVVGSLFVVAEAIEHCKGKVLATIAGQLRRL